MVVGILIIMILILYWNIFEFTSLKKPLQEVYLSSKDFNGIIVTVKYAGFFQKNRLIFDMRKVPLTVEVLSPFKYLLCYLVRLEDEGREFDKIEIQYKGKTRYILSGEAMHGLSALMLYQKPEQVAMEFPPLLTDTAGKRPFLIPYGDPQYVEQKKMHNFMDFITAWFLKDMKSDGNRPAKKAPGKMTEKKTDIPEIPSGPPADKETKTDTSDTPSVDVPAIEPEEIQ